DPDRLSQVPQGQRVRAVKAKGDWVKVEALDQPHWNGKAWEGYPGWMKATALTIDPRESPVAVASNLSRKKILVAAEHFLGKPYVCGGLSQAGIDCSGLMYLSYH